MWRIIAYRPGVFALSCFLWALFHTLPIGVSLAMAAFFDALARDSRMSLTVWFWLALPVAIELSRMVCFFFGGIIWIRFYVIGETCYALIYWVGCCKGRAHGQQFRRVRPSVAFGRRNRNCGVSG